MPVTQKNEIGNLQYVQIRNAQDWKSETEIENHVVLTFDPLIGSPVLEYDAVCSLVSVLALSMLKDTQFVKLPLNTVVLLLAKIKV